MTSKLSRLCFLAFSAVLSATALAGPDTGDAPRRAEHRPKTVVKWHKQIVDKVLVACGVVEPAPVYVAPGYLETTGPAPVLVYRGSGPMHPRRVSRPEGEEKPVDSSAAVEPATPPAAADPASSPAPAPASVAPVPAPAPTDAEPGVLPEADANGSATRGHTDELLSYFQRQHAAAHPYTASPIAPGTEGVGPNDPGAEPSFLQAPQPEQPILPPSRATYHVVP